MGVQISNIIPKKEIELVDLSGKKIAIDAYNTSYQFLTIVRDRMTGEPLRDSKGRITSHLSGLFYRTVNWMETGIKPIFIFDGQPPEFKKKTLLEREDMKRKAREKWDEALKKGEMAITYAQAASRLTKDMVEESKLLLDYMGVPWIQAPSEGEAMCSNLCKKEVVYATGSQDTDSLLFGSPRLVKNLSITGRRKLPKKEAYIEIKPELIELQQVLDSLGINQEQLITLGILVGTDYAPGVEGVGPKTALKLVKEHKTLEKVLENVKWDSEVDAEDIYNFFLNPPVTDKYKIEWKEVNREKLIKFMVDEHDFSRERMEKSVDRLQQAITAGRQSSLSGWLK